MLYRAANSDSNVKLLKEGKARVNKETLFCKVKANRSDDFARLADLHIVRNIAGVNGRARRVDCGLHFACKLKTFGLKSACS